MSIEIKEHHNGWKIKYSNGVVGDLEIAAAGSGFWPVIKNLTGPAISEGRKELIPPPLEDLRIGPFESNEQGNKVLKALREMGMPVGKAWNNGFCLKNYQIFSCVEIFNLKWNGMDSKPNISPTEFFHHFGTTDLKDMVIGPFEDLAQMRKVWETLKGMGEEMFDADQEYAAGFYTQCLIHAQLYGKAMWYLRDRDPNTSPTAFLEKYSQKIDRSMVIGDFEDIEQVRAVWEKLKVAGEEMHPGDNEAVTKSFMCAQNQSIYWFEDRCWACNTNGGMEMTITAAEFLDTVQVGNPHPEPRIVTGTITVTYPECIGNGCQEFVGSDWHERTDCPKYFPKFKLPGPLALTLENYTPEELNEKTRTEHDKWEVGDRN